MTSAGVIRSGGIIGFRTDTFYGLGADPFNRTAVDRIRQLKGREDDKPILLLISDQAQVKRLLAQRSEIFDRVAQAFWPGPLTIVGVAAPELPEEITARTGTVGVRLPDDASVRDLVRECGGALTATSANPAGREPARSAREVRDYFPAGLDLILDGGDVSATQPSTVLDVITKPPRVVREGAVPRNAIEQLLNQP